MKVIQFIVMIIALLMANSSIAKVRIDELYYELNETSKYATITYGNNSSGNVVIPSTITHNGVTYDVTAIGFDAFRNCRDLTSVVIPNSITSICGGAFQDCWQLKEVTIPISVKEIGPNAFSTGTMDLIVYISDLEAWCNIKLESGAFGAYRLFLNGKEIDNLVIPGSVETVGAYSFRNCRSLRSVTLSEGIDAIDERSFEGCWNIESLSMPLSLVSIGFRAFYDCRNLESIQFSSNLYDILPESFEGTLWLKSQPDGAVYAGSVFYKYKGTMPENTDLVIKSGTKGIAAIAFRGCSNLNSVTMPEDVCNIGMSSFSGCTGLMEIDIPKNVRSIGDGAFQSCLSLDCIAIPEGVNVIGNYAFEGCKNLTSVSIPNSVITIGKYAFYGCDSLSSITSYMVSPPILEADVFPASFKMAGALYIPQGLRLLYSERGWGIYFVNMYEFNSNAVKSTDADRTQWRVLSVNNTLVVSNTPSGETIKIYDLSGRVISTVRSLGADTMIPISQKERMIIVQVGSETAKIAM